MMNRFILALRSPKLWPWLIIVPGAILRLWDITSSPLWYDERYTQLLAGLPLDRLISATAGDVHPPLYYLLVWGVSIAGNSALVLRLFSAVFSIAALVMFWPLTKEVKLPTMARLVALAVMAFHPANLFYAQEARMYSFLQLLVIIQLLALLTEDWWTLGIYTTAALYTHNYALLYTAFLGLAGLLKQLKKPRAVYRPGVDGEFSGTGIIPLVMSIGIPGLLWLPWSAVLYRQMQFVSTGYWIEPMSAGYIIANALHIWTGHMFPEEIMPFSVFALVVILVMLFIHGLKTKQFTLIALGLGPFILAVTVSILWKPMLLFRGLIGTIPALALLAGSAVYSCKRRGRLVAAALAIPLVAGMLWQIGANSIGRIKGTPLIKSVAVESTVPVVHLNDVTMVLNGTPGRDYFLEAGCPLEDGALSSITRRAIGFKTIGIDELPDRFVFSGILSPLSTACHQAVYESMAAKMSKVYRVDHQVYSWGVWYADSNR
jgi:uncharacterized membrane protein